MPLPRVPALSALAGMALVAAVLAPAADAPALRPSAAGVTPLALPVATGCEDLLPPLAGTGRVVPAPDGRVPGLPDDVDVEVRGGAVVTWTSDAALRAVLVAGTDRVNLYRYEPVAMSDADLRAPVGPDGRVAAVLGVELCRSGPAEPDLAEVCIRAGHVPLAGPSTYADGRFDGALGPGFTAEVDPDDGTLSWRSDGTPVSAVVTATSTPVLVEYEPPATSGTDVPFLGRTGTTGRVQLCGVVLAAPDGPAPGTPIPD